MTRRAAGPRSKLPRGPGRAARLESTLAVDADGCVYGGDARVGVALVWPRDYEARVGDDDLVVIVDTEGRVVLREGQAFSAGGGLLPESDQRAEVQHAREIHGCSVFVIQHRVEGLE